jgi:hypothetical protein
MGFRIIEPDGIEPDNMEDEGCSLQQMFEFLESDLEYANTITGALDKLKDLEERLKDPSLDSRERQLLHNARITLFASVELFGDAAHPEGEDHGRSKE